MGLPRSTSNRPLRYCSQRSLRVGEAGLIIIRRSVRKASSSGVLSHHYALPVSVRNAQVAFSSFFHPSISPSKVRRDDNTDLKLWLGRAGLEHPTWKIAVFANGTGSTGGLDVTLNFLFWRSPGRWRQCCFSPLPSPATIAIHSTMRELCTNLAWSSHIIPSRRWKQCPRSVLYLPGRGFVCRPCYSPEEPR